MVAVVDRGCEASELDRCARAVANKRLPRKVKEAKLPDLSMFERNGYDLIALLDVLDDVAAAHDTTVAAVSLAWLRQQPLVVAPLASARTPQQLAELLASVDVELSADELARLSA